MEIEDFDTIGKELETMGLDWLVKIFINATLNKDQIFTLSEKDASTYELLLPTGQVFCEIYKDKIIDIIKYIIEEGTRYGK